MFFMTIAGFVDNSAAQRIDQLQFLKTREVAIARWQGSTVFNGQCGQVSLRARAAALASTVTQMSQSLG